MALGSPIGKGAFGGEATTVEQPVTVSVNLLPESQWSNTSELQSMLNNLPVDITDNLDKHLQLSLDKHVNNLRNQFPGNLSRRFEYHHGEIMKHVKE